MIKCKEVVRVVSSSTENLNWAKKMELRLHLLMCKHCSNYVGQLEVLTGAVATFIQKRFSTDGGRVANIEDKAIHVAKRKPME